MIEVDHRALVSRADIVYHSPAEVSIEGTPIGNGRMGTNVWTTPRSVRFQINRNDVISSDRNHAGAHGCPVDYRAPCGRVEVGFIEAVFEDRQAFMQRLSLYNAEFVIEGRDVQVRGFVSSARDLLVLEVDDRRKHPGDVHIDVPMWRQQDVTTPLYHWDGKTFGQEEIDTGTHTASYNLDQIAGRIILEQTFTESRIYRDEDYHASSVVAVQAICDDTRIETPDSGGLWQPAVLQWNEDPVHTAYQRAPARQGGRLARRIVIPAANGYRTILVSSCASSGANTQPRGLAMSILDEAASLSYQLLRDEHTEWWHGYWSRTFVHLHSEDGVADFMERVRTLHLYYAASSSRGDVPVPQGDGLIFQTEGDIPHLGTQLWHWIVESMYRPLLAADAMDVLDVYFDMYAGQLSVCEQAAKQRWGVTGGAFFPETCPTDGPTLLPDEAAAEFREYFLGRKTSDSLSPRTRILCQHDSHLFHITQCERGNAAPGTRAFTSIGHIVSTGSKIALQAWWRYRCTGDEDFLRERAYPLLKGTVELYRQLVKRADDGLYHIEGTNVMESFYLVKDSLKDLAAIRGTMPPAIRAAEILDVDADLRAQWKEIVESLAPYPMGHAPESKALNWGTLADDVWSAGHIGEINKDQGRYPFEDVWSHPIETFETWTLETGDPEADQIAQRLIDLCPNHLEIMTGRRWRPSLVRTPIAFALAGRGEELPAILAAHQSVYTPHLANGLSLFEQGIQSMGLEASGLVTMTLQCGLMQSVSPQPGEPEIISVFPAWPKEWDASFRLLARGGFLVTSSMRDGEIEWIEIESRLGEECRLRNPWSPGSCEVALTDSDDTNTVAGDILRFTTAPGVRYRITPQGRTLPEARRIQPEPADGKVSYTYTLPNGVTVGSSIGRGRDEPARNLAPFVIGNRRMRLEQQRLEDSVAARVDTNAKTP